MKSFKTVLIMAVIALLVAGPAAAGGKDKGHKHERPAVSQALLLYPDAASETALTKHYRDDPLYQKKGHPYYHRGYVVEAGFFILNIYNQGSGKLDETARDVQLVVAINDLELFESATINGFELTRASFTQTPETPRLYSDKKFPGHGVFPAYYAEIPVYDIAPGELAPVGVDIKGDPDNLLIHFDAYGRGTRDLCDDDCHGRDGKKGHGKKGDCDGKGKHRGKHKHDKGCCEKDCTQAFDIRNKLSHDVTQVGGTPSDGPSVKITLSPGAAVTGATPAAFQFELSKFGPELSTVPVTARIFNSDESAEVIYNLSREFDVFVLLTPNPREISRNLNEPPVTWSVNLTAEGDSGQVDFEVRVPARGLAGDDPLPFTLEICVPNDANTDHPFCDTIGFSVEAGPVSGAAPTLPAR